MTLESVIDLLIPLALISGGCYQLYLRGNVEKLERRGKITPGAAIRLRKSRTLFSGWCFVLSGTMLLAAELVHLISN